VLSLGVILPLGYGIKELAAADAARPAAPIAALAVGLLIGVVFIRRQVKLADPLPDLRLFRRPAIRGMPPTRARRSGVLVGASPMSSQYVGATRRRQPPPDHLDRGVTVVRCGQSRGQLW
jgi:DHA2 family multidrug resistance protein-like MFS transporter